jgi:acetyl-CoA C-acetyltransferase
MGNVVSAGVGQAPARQASKGAGLPDTVCATTVNKVCASGMKALIYASQSVALGHHDVVVAGGMESMTNAPYLVPTGRYGARYGHGQFLDGLVRDGLWDPYSDIHMGMCAEKTAADLGITRAQQDEYAALSYRRSKEASDKGLFKNEIVGVPVKVKGKETVISVDEEFPKVDFAKLAGLRPAFKKDGTITAANASKLNDGAAALVIMSADKARALGLKPIARIRGYADAEIAPIDFPVAPSRAVPLALQRAGVTAADCQYHEVNEAFAVVALANAKLLNIDIDRVNVNGGAVALGHPIGCSGARIITTLINVLQQRDATLGTASICNGGGGGSAVVIERLA